MTANDTILHILNAFVHDVKPELPDDCDLLQVYNTAYQQTLLPAIAYMNKKWRLFDRDTSASLDRFLYQSIFFFTSVSSDFERLSDTLSDAGIPHLPVKGWILRRLYPIPEIRPFGDIDILIRPADRDAVDAILRAAGFEVLTSWEPTYSYAKGNEHYEFHTNLMDSDIDGRAALCDYFASAWDHAVPEERLRFAPEPEFHLIYIFSHLAKHTYSGGAGIRMYLDIAFFIQKKGGELNWDRLAAEMKKIKLYDFFRTVLSAVESWFGVIAPIEYKRVDVQTLAALAEYSFHGGVFGHRNDAAVVAVRNNSVKSRFRVILGFLFPPREQLVRRYTYLERHKWLLPVAWIDRAFRNFTSILPRLRKLRKISRANNAKVSAYDRFMKNIGL